MNESESWTETVDRTLKRTLWDATPSPGHENPVADATSTFPRNMTRSRTGTSCYNWKEKIRLHQDATTPFSGSIRTWDHYDGSVSSLRNTKVNGGTYRSTLEGHLIAPPSDLSDNPTLSTTSADNTAKAAFLKKLTSAQRAFMGGVALGELKETLQLIKRPAVGMRNLVGSYLERVKKHAPSVRRSKRLGFISDQWLEYSFGMVPLMSDIEDGNEALKRMKERNGGTTYERISAYGSDEALVSYSSISYGVGAVGCAGRRLVKDDARVIYRGEIRCKPLSTTLMKARNLGFDPRDWAPTVWELIPYSFLVDYFTNVGDVITGWSWQRTGLSWSNKTTIQKRVSKDVELRGTTNGSSGYSLTSFAPYGHVVTQRLVNRSSYLNNYVPSLEFQLPGFGTKWLNLAALAQGRSSRGILRL